MTRRFSTEERRAQIVEAALELLATTPIEGLTTRLVAKRIGVSQPALFRHFRSRDEILEAVVERTRNSMEGLANRALQAGDRSSFEAVGILLTGLFDYVASQPGVPRLLFYEATNVHEAPHHNPLKHLLAMQKALIAELLRQGQTRGEIDQGLDSRSAADLLVSLIQGKLLQWLFLKQSTPLADEVPALLEFWEAAIRAGVPKATPIQDAEHRQDPSAQRHETAPAIAELDVRPILESGNDPLETILATLEALPVDGVLKLTAPFEPRPLLALLAKRGFRVCHRQIEARQWQVEVLGAEAPFVEDYRDLEAPEPLERILEKFETLRPSEALLARVPRFPKLLLPRLQERGASWQIFEEPEGTALLHIRRPV